MTTKSEALIRDLAALFVKYRLSDWKPLLAELEQRGGSAALAKAISQHAARASTPAKRVKTKAVPPRSAAAKPVELDLEPRFTGPHAATIDELRDAMVSKRSFPLMPDLKAAITALGIKGPLNGRRDVLVMTLTEHLDRLEPAAFEAALRNLARQEERSQPDTVPAYDRWFDLITAGRSNAR
ncbi:hypothetical protein [Sphingomonas lacusdianchii]|uniref:hypothetical protein n=1 Tax=Sphingomonas lacusdianchii TaxID=2917992 RepID=UPI001F5A8F22|nr:hypothetical protein [Sphingomonas sp. JXJ CY 53]